MKRVAVAVASLLLVASVVVAYLSTGVCSDWEEQYKRFIYSELIKNSPFIYTEKMIEEIIGERPTGCARPALNHEDLRRYRREGVGPNEFLEEQRAASRKSYPTRSSSGSLISNSSPRAD